MEGNGCKCCGKDKELRMAFCFDCVEAEGIIRTGLDMYDKGPDGGADPATEAMDRLRFLILKGWDKV